MGTFYVAAASGAGVTYSTLGTDAALFSLSASTGELAFIAAPDFEQPKDADRNNQYQLSIRATANGLSATQAITVTVTDVLTAPVVKIVFPTTNSNVGIGDTLLEFSVMARLEDGETGAALTPGWMEVTAQNAAVSDMLNDNNVWHSKIMVEAGKNTVTVSADYMGKTYSASLSFNNDLAVKPEAMALGNKDARLYLFNGLTTSLDAVSLLNKTVSELLFVGSYSGNRSFPALSEYESFVAKGWGYTVSNYANDIYYVTRWNMSTNATLNYVQKINGAANAADFIRSPTSLVLDENNDTLASNDRLLVLQHVNGSALVSALDVSDKAVTGTTIALATPLPSLYATLWTQPADITSADKIAFDAATQTLVVLDKKAASTDVVAYGFNAATGFYDQLKFKTAVGTNNARVVVNSLTGQIYVGSGTELANNLTITKIDISTGIASSIYDGVKGSGLLLSSISDVRVNDKNDTIMVLDGFNNRVMIINPTTFARTVFKDFSVAAGVGFQPKDIVFDGFNNLFVTDGNSGGIVGIDASNGQRLLVRPAQNTLGISSTAEAIKFTSVQGLITTEVQPDQTGTLAKTDLLSGMSSLLMPFAASFTPEQFGTYVDPQGAEFAVTTKGSEISVTNLASGLVTLYNPAVNYALTPDAVSVIEIDQKTGVLYAINNVSKKLISINLLQPASVAKDVLSGFTVTKPSSLKVDGNNVYFLDSGALIKLNVTAKTQTPISAGKTVAYPNNYSTAGIYTMGEHMDIDRKNKIAYLSNKAGSAVIGVSLLTGDRIVVSH